ncbi:hypothetical protein, partial [uncultured Sphingomonas sp.]|uniref:hypothetical protein n=1 Tax=uncultured Sphingomonas sp. TaxID=158754 RepID=UPI0025ECE0DF
WRAVLLLGWRAWSWRTHDVPVPYGFLPFQRKDRTIKSWDQTTSWLARAGHSTPEFKVIYQTAHML